MVSRRGNTKRKTSNIEQNEALMELYNDILKPKSVKQLKDQIES